MATRWVLAREIGESSSGSGEGPLGVDDPLGRRARVRTASKALFSVSRARSPKRPRRPDWFGKRGEAFEKEPAEETRQHAHGQGEAGLQAIQRPVPATGRRGRDGVDVGMVGERRAPGVQHGGEADARLDLRVGGEGGQRLGGGPEQEVVNGGLVLERDSSRPAGVKTTWYREPAGVRLGGLRAIAAPRRRTSGSGGCGRNCRRCARALQSSQRSAAERGGAAGLDRRHDLQLAEAHMAGVGLRHAAPWA